MKNNIINDRKMRYALTFLFWNNILAIFLTLAVYKPGGISFFSHLLCILVISHTTALVCLLSIDLLKPILRRIFPNDAQKLYLSYVLPLSIALLPGLVAGFYASKLLAQFLGIKWNPDIWEVIIPGILFGFIVFLLNILYFNWIFSVRAKYMSDLALKTAQTHLLETKLQVLLTELNPHLLFNSLNSIVSVLRDNTDLAETMLLKLCDYYQSVLLAFDKKSLSLSEETELCLKFIEMQQEKYPNLHFEADIQEEIFHTFFVPPLILQPLVENALKHGFRDKAKSQLKKIRISAEKSANRVHIKVFDNGSLVERDGQRREKSHGLRNCEDRLKGFFDESCELSLTSDLNGTTVLLDVPYVSATK